MGVKDYEGSRVSIGNPNSPLLIALLVPFRMSLGRFFDEKDLEILDSEGSEEIIEQQDLHP